MKKTFKFFAAAVAALVCSISCELNSIELQNVVSEGNTFTATIGQKAPEAAPASKVTVDDAGKCAWSEGDKIIVYNGNTTSQIVISNVANFADYVEVITITADMLSNDNKTVSFSTALAAPASGKKWHFYATNNLSNVYCIYGDTANMIGGSVSATSQTEVPFVATASASAVGESLSFKHALGYLKMHGSAWLYKVAVRSNGYDASAAPNNDAIVQSYNVIASDGSVTGRNDEKDNDYVCSVNDVHVGKDFYVALAPAHIWASGITIDVFYGTQGSDSWGWKAIPRNPAKSVAITTPFSVKAGQIINLGDILADHSKKSTYYEMWEAGQDIFVNGVKYNKATYGEGVLLTENTEYTADPSGKVFFLDDDAVFTMNDKTRFSNGLILIGNTPGARPKLKVNAWTTMLNGAGKSYLFKNLTIEYTSGNYVFRDFGGDAPLGSFAIDDCSINAPRIMCIDSDGLGVNNLSVTNSDWKISENGYLTRSYSGGAKATKFGTITFSNNVVFTKGSENYYTIGFNNDNAEGASTLQKAIMKNNTFVNLSCYGAAFFYWGCDFVFECDNNLMYYGKALTGNVSLARRIANDSPLTDVTVGTNYQYQAASGDKNYIVCWDPRKNITTLSESPFASMDFTNGKFTKTSAAASYGATR